MYNLFYNKLYEHKSTIDANYLINFTLTCARVAIKFLF